MLCKAHTIKEELASVQNMCVYVDIDKFHITVVKIGQRWYIK